MAKRVQHLIVDSGAFIRNSPIHELAANIYSVDGAIKEIKDKATLQRLQFLPYELKVKTPDTENYKFVVEFSKKTGDYCSLSATDLQIIALTYQLEKEHVGTEHLNREPTCQVVSTAHAKPQRMEGFYYPHQSDEGSNIIDDDECLSENLSVLDSSSIAQDSNFTSNITDNGAVEEHVGTSVDDSMSEEVSLDNDHFQSEINMFGNKENEAWITADNLAEIQQKMGNVSLDSNTDCVVACLTTDFAIQNVLLQMGMNVLSVDGVLIRNTRVFILRCFACYKTTTKMEKRFCPNCGNKTLKRVSISVNEDGTKNIHINFRRPINIRGTKYSLPMPRGGKHPDNPVLCEDQPIPENRPPKATLKKIDVLSPEYIASGSPFAVRDVYSRAAGLGYRGLDTKQSRRNPNQWSVKTGNKKRNKK